MKTLQPKYKVKTVWKYEVQHTSTGSTLWHERAYDTEHEMLRSANSVIQDGSTVRNFRSEDINIIESFTKVEG